jgi:UDP-N-acetylmuramoylalanine--D-glutamate ligase
MDFKNKRVTVMGLGLHGGGVSTVEFLCKKGARVLATDLRDQKTLQPSLDKLKKYKIEYVLGEHREKDFSDADMIIKNPGVKPDSPYLKIARKNKIPIETDIGIFFMMCPAQIIGITGTRGKSTTATLIYKILKKKFKRVFLAGNIGDSVLNYLDQLKKGDWIVLEMSSWQTAGLRTIKKSPHISVITNIMDDHMNFYKTKSDYIDDKKQIFKYQKKNDWLVLNYDNPYTRKMAEEVQSKVLFYSSTKTEPSKADFSDMAGGGVIFPLEKSGQKICFAGFKRNIIGLHNLSNIIAAVAVAKIFKIPDDKIKKTLKEFKGVPFRQELIAVKRGVKYINDTTATTPDAAIAALKTLSDKKNIVLIAGGADKNLDFKKMVLEIEKKVKFLILLKGTATDKILKLKKAPIVDSMAKAVALAQKNAKAGNIVLLSPGAASFGLFNNEFDRGQQFNNIVKKL